MKPSLDPSDWESSVVAVPPLCRLASLEFDPDAQGRLVHHLESGGVRILLYGGNANFYHVAPSEYGSILSALADMAGPDTVVIPSAGPSFGLMMDQARQLAALPVRFPAVMVLPTLFPMHPLGVIDAVRRFTDTAGIPVVLYMKDAGYLSASHAALLWKEGRVAWVKYAVVRPDPLEDPLLRELVDGVPRDRIVSGIGEQPALVHLRDFALGGFTSGCVCVAPRLSTAFLQAARQGDWERVDALRALFEPLETLRNRWGPIPVLHHAVAASGIAPTGPMLPLLHDLDTSQQDLIGTTASALAALDARP